MKKFIFILAMAGLVAVACDKENNGEQTKEKIVTLAATHISCRSAEIAGRAKLPGSQSSDPELSLGILYSTSPEVSDDTSIKIEAGTYDSEYNYEVNTEVLEPETKYYYKSYLSLSGETFYGEIKSFTTLPLSSMIQTADATEIHPKEAVLNAMLNLSDCNYEGLEYGFEITPKDGSAYTIKSTGFSQKKFSVNAESLSRDTDYTFVAYVTLDGRTYKGAEKSFTTTSIQASVTVEPSNLSYHAATISGKVDVTSEGSFTKSATLYYSKSFDTQEYLLAIGIAEDLTLDEDGSFSIDLKSLKSSTEYYYIIVSKVDEIELVTDVKSFSTQNIEASLTAEFSDETYYTTTISGELTVTSEGNFTKYAYMYYDRWVSTASELKFSGRRETLYIKNDGTFSSIVTKLTPDAKYNYYIAYKVDDAEFATSVSSFNTISFPIPQMVDLGLSVKWASFNIGASKPEEYGCYFACGDVGGQSWLGTSWSGDGFSTNPQREVDSDNNLKPEYDAAHVNLGGDWRMPTSAEMQELINNCTATWTTNYNGTGVSGMIFTGKKTGYKDKSIFIPAAGYSQYDDLIGTGGTGCFWTSSSSTTDSATSLSVSSNGTDYHNCYRKQGQSIRAVSK